jgi:hypothetical protein
VARRTFVFALTLESGSYLHVLTLRLYENFCQVRAYVRSYKMVTFPIEIVKNSDVSAKKGTDSSIPAKKSRVARSIIKATLARATGHLEAKNCEKSVTLNFRAHS